MNDVFLLRLLATQAWQIAVLAVIVGVAVRFASKSPRAAHLLWLIVVVKRVTPPIWGIRWGSLVDYRIRFR